MPGQTAKENGKKGGRPKGSKASHTLEAEAYKKYLIQQVVKKKAPLVKALIDKGLSGDVPALKEIHERALGKVKESMDLNIKPIAELLDGIEKDNG